MQAVIVLSGNRQQAVGDWARNFDSRPHDPFEDSAQSLSRELLITDSCLAYRLLLIAVSPANHGASAHLLTEAKKLSQQRCTDAQDCSYHPQFLNRDIRANRKSHQQG
jgi:hypothetical protein